MTGLELDFRMWTRVCRFLSPAVSRDGFWVVGVLGRVVEWSIVVRRPPADFGSNRRDWVSAVLVPSVPTGCWEDGRVMSRFGLALSIGLRVLTLTDRLF